MISSRTPDGRFQLCPLCEHEVCIDPSTLPRFDATCPCCGYLLEFDEAPRLFDSRLWRSQSYEELLVSVGENHLGIISVELVTHLHHVLEELTEVDRLPPRDQALRCLLECGHWSEFIGRLEAWQPVARHGAWLKKTRESLSRRKRQPRLKT